MNHHSLDSLQVMQERNVTSFVEASCCSVQLCSARIQLLQLHVCYGVPVYVLD